MRTYRRDARGRFASGGGGSAGRGSGSAPKRVIRDRQASGGGKLQRLRPMPVQQSGMSDRMKIELADFKAGNFKAVNEFARSGKLPEGVRQSSMAAQVKSLDAAMKRGRTTRATTVYRGIQIPNADKVGASLVGKSIKASAFQSTSRRRREAETFAGRGAGAMMFEIKVPKGSKAVNMDKFQSGASKGEREILLGRGGTLTVTGVRQQGMRTIVSGTWNDPALSKATRKPRQRKAK